jgi:copper resistance protein D
VSAARAALDLAMTAVLGLGLVPLLFTPNEHRAAHPVRSRAYRVAVPTTLVWLVSALVSIGLQTAELAPVLGVTLSTVTTYLQGFGAAQALLANAAVAAAATVAAVAGVRTTGLLPARLLVASAAAGVLTLVASGHAGALTSEWHELAMVSLELHVFAAALWTGGLAAMIWLLARQRALLSRALPRYSRLAGMCLGVVAASGLSNALVELSSGPAAHLPSDLVTTTYGLLVLGKIGCLLVLAVLGARIRYRLLPQIEQARPTNLALWACWELTVMGAAFGIAVVLSRSAI